MKKNVNIVLVVIVILTLLLSTVSGASIKKTVEVAFNSINITVNGKKVDADNIVYNGTTYVPLRAIGEMLDKDVGWNQETNTASISDKKTIAKEQTTSYSRLNPAPVGIKQIVEVDKTLDKYSAEVTITESIRGEKAWKLIKEANKYNKEPEADEEYILSKIKVKILNVKDDKKISVSSYDFTLYNEGNAKYDYTSVVEPKPSLDTDLYVGAEHEGYASYMVKKSDANPKLVYGQKYDGTGGAWFKLNK